MVYSAAIRRTQRKNGRVPRTDLEGWQKFALTECTSSFFSIFTVSRAGAVY